MEKRKLESLELQYFLYRSSKRLERVRNGERLSDVITHTSNILQPKSDNPDPDPTLIALKNVLDKQYEKTDKQFNIEEQLIIPFAQNLPNPKIDDFEDSEKDLVKSFKNMENLYNYLTGSTFDPRQEYYKEIDIHNFFKLKYKLISQYLGIFKF